MRTSGKRYLEKGVNAKGIKETIGKKRQEEGVVLVLCFINFLAISGGVAERKDKETFTGDPSRLKEGNTAGRGK